MIFRFREPRAATYRPVVEPASRLRVAERTEWLPAMPQDGTTNRVQLGSRIVLQLKAAADLERLLKGRPVQLARTVAPNTFILQAPDAWAAAAQAQELAASTEVTVCYPIMRRPAGALGAYAAQPNDSYYYAQWYLESRNPSDSSLAGVSLNVRAAWPWTLGEGITVAVADTGIELDHPDLAARLAPASHENFSDPNTNAAPAGGTEFWAHGTAVAGLVAAEGNNALGMTGVAPAARLASWVIFTPDRLFVSDEKLMDMFQFQSNVVSVQNHSWSTLDKQLIQGGPTLLEQIGISNAVTFGREGRGVVMVRSAGNDRALGANANDDAYVSDPRVIAVGAVRADNRFASYSEPGACLLVAAPSAETGAAGLFTTDLRGNKGANPFNYLDPTLNDYRFNNLGFNGTSASAPLVAGVAALILSANPKLTYRDVQQILIHSARQFDPADPDLSTNGAGFVVSHNAGFGVPD
ncbi:MAG: S8 family serine peptidase, partial [Pedosphaera parvula]|nr:S8 family serine peptidase [Pedosphaera parvula]